MNDQTVATPATRKITIQGIEFTAPQPYKAGPVELTEGEASALNQTFAENLRNNFASKIKAALDDYRKANSLPEGQEIAVTVLDQDTLQSEFATYADDYEFGVRGVGTPRVTLDPVTREANSIAWDKIKAKLREKNIKINSVSEEQKAAWISQLVAKNPAIVEEAKRRAEAFGAIALESLE